VRLGQCLAQIVPRHTSRSLESALPDRRSIVASGRQEVRARLRSARARSGHETRATDARQIGQRRRTRTPLRTAGDVQRRRTEVKRPRTDPNVESRREPETDVFRAPAQQTRCLLSPEHTAVDSTHSTTTSAAACSPMQSIIKARYDSGSSIRGGSSQIVAAMISGLVARASARLASCAELLLADADFAARMAAAAAAKAPTAADTAATIVQTLSLFSTTMCVPRSIRGPYSSRSTRPSNHRPGGQPLAITDPLQLVRLELGDLANERGRFTDSSVTWLRRRLGHQPSVDRAAERGEDHKFRLARLDRRRHAMTHRRARPRGGYGPGIKPPAPPRSSSSAALTPCARARARAPRRTPRQGAARGARAG
jgi:hypothetical protein